ncbi:MAG: hypothetical protein WBB33_00940 [Candidatus Saccharimonadales bacterium]
MNEKLPQGEVDRIFAEMFSCGIQVAADRQLEIDIPTLNEHFIYLKNQGYTDEEIEMIFDLTLSEGEAHEI